MKFSTGTLSAATAVLAGTVFLPAPAQAATPAGYVRINHTAVEFTAAAGAVNDLTVTRSGRVLFLDDRVAIKAGPGCAAVPGDSTKVRCLLSTSPAVVLTVNLRDQNDRFVNRTALGTYIDGGNGNDRITGGAGADMLRGQNGNDILVGGAGMDSLSGGAGNDELYGGLGRDHLSSDTGRDLLRGGSGRDSVYYGERRTPLSIDLDGAKGDDGARGEGDTVGADVEDIIGGYAADRLIGNAAGNHIHGGPGNDYIAGGQGHDVLVGQSGHDTLRGDAGDDHLIGEQDHRGATHPDGEVKDDPRARDHLNGGSAAARGDICVGGPVSVKVSCEIRRGL